ncbi:MAG: hypothetical protein WCF22_12805 [Candidatus Sulfotelmatobacter sp.]
MSANPQTQPALVSTSEKSLKLREVRFEDYAQVAALAAKFQLYTESYPGWTHLWTNNPAYREIKGKFPMGWVLENAEGAVCGYLGNIPLHYEFEGKTLLAATTRAWVVDTPYRLYSLWLLEAYFQQPNVDLFLSTTVNPQSALGFDFFQGVRVPVGDWDRTLFWITNHQGFTESFLRKKLAAMAKTLSYPLSFGLFLCDQFKRSRIQGNSNTVKVAPCASFDDRFDAFWATQRMNKYNSLLAVRTREVLEWHFKFALLQNAAWIYIVESNSGLAAYSVFLRHDYPEIGLTRLRLADFQCREQKSAPALLAAMLEVAMDRCRQECIHMFEVIGLAPELEKELEHASPHRRVMPNWLYFYKANNPSLAERLTNAAVWEPSLFDGDSSLWSENLVTGNSEYGRRQ